MLIDRRTNLARLDRRYLELLVVSVDPPIDKDRVEIENKRAEVIDEYSCLDRDGV